MQLSLYTDYACRTLMYLALRDRDERSSIAAIAAAYNISGNHLIKVVHSLGKLGFIETTRGRNGGIRLARPAENIRMGDVIRQTETNMNLVECFNPATNSCPIAGPCGLKPWLWEAMEAFLTSLDRVTLADTVINRNALSRSLDIKAVERTQDECV